MGASPGVTRDELDTDEVAAVMAVVQMYIASSARAEPTIDASERWARAGRLEAQGIPVTVRRLSPGWRM